MAGGVSLSELEQTLLEVGRRLADPPEVDLAFMVGSRLRQEATAPVPARRLRRLEWLPRLEWRTVAYAGAAVMLLLAGVLTLSPSARDAVAGWLGLRGVRIEVTPTPLPSTIPSGPEALDLGTRVTLQEAQKEVGFRILFPGAPGLGTPDEIRVQPLYISEQVFLVYRRRPGFPAAGETGIAVLISEFRAAPDFEVFKKVAAGGAGVEFVRVNGDPGYWLEGRHEVVYVDENGVPIQDTARLAANVLVWQHGPVTLRIESSLSLAESLRIAQSFE